MDRGDHSSAVACELCREAFTLPEEDVNSNLPHMLSCGHIYCTTCRLSCQYDSVIRCPVCEMDEALPRGAENLAQLEHIYKTLTTRPVEQVKKERARLETELKQAADKAVHTIQKWRDMQLKQLTKLEAEFSTTQMACSVWERIEALRTAMQMARKIGHVPSLMQHCSVAKVLETLWAPVDSQSFDVKCMNMDSGMSCVFQSESLQQSLSLSLKMEEGNPKQCTTTLRRAQKSPATHRISSESSSPSPKPPCRLKVSQHNTTSDLQTPEVIVEEIIEERQEQAALPPTGPELAYDRGRMQRRRRRSQMFTRRRNVSQHVVVTHIVNPNHFYVCYLTDMRKNETLSRKINQFCYKDGSRFTASDTVETDSVIFVKTDGQWCRANVLRILENGCVEDVKACPVDQLASIQVYFLDYGLTKSLTIQSEEVPTESSLKAVNNHLRKVSEAMVVELGHFVPQAIRCSLKDLVPYDLIEGWSEEARAEFHNVVGSAAVEMRLLGQDGDTLLVDLKKAPMNQSSDVPISVREHLVLIEVARFYSPVMLGRKPLLYYPPLHPKFNTEVNALVSHINNPADFFIQQVESMEYLLLSAKLQECYSAIEAGGDYLRVHCPVMGQGYVARFDDKWYRAQVIGHPGDRKVEVYYVDLGNKKILSVSDLRMIKDEFFAVPSMAIHCCLSDVTPLDGESWSDTCTDRLISLVYKKLVTIVATGTVQKTEPVPVKLFESSLDGPQSNIAELLVREGLACFKAGLKSKDSPLPGEESDIWDPPLEHGLATEDADAPDQKILREQDEELLHLQPLLKLHTQLKDLNVKVSHVNSPSSFYVQLTQYNSQLKRVCKLVKECALTEPQAVAWRAGMYCAAHVNGVWERGQISSDVTSSKIAELMRCDHGNTVKLHVCNLRPLPSSLMGSLALECTLTGIRPAGGQSTWTATACDLLSHYLTGASAVMTVKELTDERPVPVTLFCTNKRGQFVSIADFLASEGLALRERKPRNADVHDPKESDAQSPASETQTECSDDGNTPQPPSLKLVPPHKPPKPAPRTMMSAEKVTTKLYQPPELPPPGHIQINVSAIGEDGLIYGRTKNAEYQLEQLKKTIQQSLKTLPTPKSYTWKSVLGCAVMGPDMSWYRGQLLEVLGEHVKVQYVDSGLVEDIPAVHLYPILLCDDVPQLCMPCRLHSIKPVDGRWQQDAVAMLREMLLNRCVEVHIMELPTDPRGPVTVELFLDGLSLSQILCCHKYATTDQTVSTLMRLLTPASLDDWDISIEGLEGPEEPMLGPFIYPDLPQEGEQFPVRVKHLVTPNELFLWPLREGVADVEVDGETLDEALKRINANINSLSQLHSFCSGSPCLAEYSDGNYYRAKLIRFTSLEPTEVLVHHVDFGSDDTLPITKLCQMPAELLRFPSRALKVKVAGFKAPSVRNTQEYMLPYSPEWSMKAAMDMINLLNGNIEATVVAREPELKVLLYNEDGQLVHLPLVSSGLAELE